MPRSLFSTHGQLWQWSYAGMTGVYVHQGVDISACAREPVFAAEAGTVVFSNFRDPGVPKEYQELIISRGDDASTGIRYLHLGAAAVAVGDRVERDQLIGTIANWLTPCSYDHLHLQVVQCTSTTWKVGDPWPTSSAADTGNPLSTFDPAVDKLEPECKEVDSDLSGEPACILFFKDDSETELKPDELSGSVDVIARLHDACFDVHASCGAGASACTEVSSKEVAPYRAALRISSLDTAAGGAPATELWPSIAFAEAINSDVQEALAKLYYHSTSTARYGERDLRFVLTQPGTGSTGGAWTPKSGEKYQLDVTFEDRAGNVVKASKMVVIP